jgi:MOSC domain-containing protein YiiM
MDGTITAVAVVQRLKTKSWEVPYTTGIDKAAVPGRVPLARTGLAGDVQCDRENHGGTYAAVYAYADEDARTWADELGYAVEPGRFGENLRTSGIDVTGAEIGERWQVGPPGEGVLLEVTSPRTPCRTFAEHMGEPRWVKRFTRRGAPGAYFRVLAAGGIAEGDEITVVHRPGHGVTIGHTTQVARPEAMAALLRAADEQGLDLDPSLRHNAEHVLRRRQA